MKNRVILLLYCCIYLNTFISAQENGCNIPTYVKVYFTFKNTDMSIFLDSTLYIELQVLGTSQHLSAYLKSDNWNSSDAAYSQQVSTIHRINISQHKKNLITQYLNRLFVFKQDSLFIINEIDNPNVLRDDCFYSLPSIRVQIEKFNQIETIYLDLIDYYKKSHVGTISNRKVQYTLSFRKFLQELTSILVDNYGDSKLREKYQQIIKQYRNNPSYEIL